MDARGQPPAKLLILKEGCECEWVGTRRLARLRSMNHRKQLAKPCRIRMGSVLADFETLAVLHGVTSLRSVFFDQRRASRGSDHSCSGASQPRFALCGIFWHIVQLAVHPREP